MSKEKILSLYFFVVFLYSATPCNIFSLNGLTHNPLFISIPIIFSLYVGFRCKINYLNKKLLWICAILLLWNLIHIAIDRSFSVSPFPFIEIFVAYTLIKAFPKDLFLRFESLTVFLSKIAIVGWLLCLVAHETILNVAYEIGSPGANISQSLYVFSIPIKSTYREFLLRNCGFAWEPGRFSCFLIIAILLNVHRTKMNLKDKNFIILLIALISAQSTTGYLVLIVLLSIYYIANKKVNPIYLVLASILVISVFSLPFMTDKISTLYNAGLNIDQEISDLNYLNERGLRDNNDYYVPQRFQGFMFQYANLQESPLLIGEGRDFTKFYVNKILKLQVAPSEGLLMIIIQYGVILAFCLYFMLWKSSRIVSDYFNNRQTTYLFFVAFILLNFSYCLWEVPIFLAIILFNYFQNNKLNNTYATYINNNSNLQ